MSEPPLNNKNIAGGAGITAGNDVSIGDVTGQLAIGEYINQFMIKEPSGEALVKLMDFLEHKRQEKVNLEILSSYSTSALPDYPPRLKEFVTQNRIEELNKALIYLQTHRILLFTGMGGTGKTTLARALVDLRPANVPTPFWFDFKQNEDAKVGDILEKLAAYMSSPDLARFREEKREAGKKDIDRLTDKLQEEKSIWLIFDNLETILDDIYFRDEYIDLLFSSLRNNTHQAKMIITSRIFPKLKYGEYLVDLTEGEKQDVKGLKTNFAVDYLVKNGLADIGPDKLEKLAMGVDGHPLAMKLLVELVKEFGEEDILEDLSMYQEQKEDTILKARKLFDKLAGEERELLEHISVFREPVGMNGLKEMFTGKMSLKDIKKLVDKSLLETDHKGNYWLHPLVQEFAYDDLENKVEAHKIACKYYLSLPLPAKPAKKESVLPLIEAHHHACMAKEYDDAFHIVFDNNLHEKLDSWGNCTLLIDLCSKMLPEFHFKNGTLLEGKTECSLILGSMGNAYRELSEFRKAIEYYEQALRIANEIRDRREEELWLGGLGNVYRDLSEFRKAIEYYEQALKIAKEVGNKSDEGKWLGGLGSAYRILSELRIAKEYYEQALKIAKEVGDRRREGLSLGNIGNVHLGLGESREAIEYYEQALIIAKEIGDRRGEENQLGNMGSAYRILGEPKKAIENYEQALKIAKEIGSKIDEQFWLGNMGNVYLGLGESREAIEYYEQALIIAKEIGDKRGEGLWFGGIGNLYLDMSEFRRAIEYFVQALKITKEVGDRRREGLWLVNMGVTYSNLSEFRRAIEYYKQALEIAKEVGDNKLEESLLGNLGGIFYYLSLGDTYYNPDEFRRAIEYYEQALKVARDIRSKSDEQKLLEILRSAKEKVDRYSEKSFDWMSGGYIPYTGD